jgi:hypothetical protein
MPHFSVLQLAFMNIYNNGNPIIFNLEEIIALQNRANQIVPHICDLVKVWICHWKIGFQLGIDA